MKNFKRATFAAGLLALSAGASFATQVDVVVDKAAQRMHVMVDGEEKYTWLVSTGAPGHETPSGHFHFFRFDKNHFSKEWDDAPMPNSMFFTALGHAVHGSSHVKALGTPASHGCVRLAPENAAILWDLVQQAGVDNNTVTIKGGLFDKDLTTADTFKMYNNNVSLASASDDYDSTPHRGLFWWVKQTPNRDTQDSQPSFFGSKQQHSLFGMKKTDKKTASADKKAGKKVAAKKKLPPKDSKKPVVVGAN